jgi:hypothetical protein
MRTLSRTTVAVFACLLIGAATASAQATRTWVSGVGDDVNPCSRTAPCKTFAGAISKTAAGGEISVLDPGGFGAVTITKSITINGADQFAGITGAGVHAITVNAATTDVVVLRNLQINGIGSGLTGIRFLGGGTLVVDKVNISGFETGIDAAAGHATVTQSLFTNNRVVAVHGRAGTLTVERSLIVGNQIAVLATSPGTVRLSDNSVFNNLTGFGCGGGILASAGNNRKANNVGGSVPVCAPTDVINIQ